MIKSTDYRESLTYIRNYWKKITRYYPKDKQLHLGLPHRYIAPNNAIFRNDQFYWDSYFIILGLLSSGKISLAKGMADNLCYLYRRFGIIPMRNRYYNLGTSQTPFLSSIATAIFEQEGDRKWYSSVMKVAELELKNYWMNKDLTEKHIMPSGLSRYCDHFITHLGSEHESGWDMTSRFSDHCLHYLPVDLNSCLYKYESDLSEFYQSRKNQLKHRHYRKQLEKRKRVMNELMWNKKKKFFFDYNFHLNKQSGFLSAAGFYPLWAKIATQDQADLIREHTLPLLEFEGGIVNTQATRLAKETKQHDFPNGWPHQQWIVVKGLLNYGYRADAERIAKKWLDLNQCIFLKTGKFWEKYDVVNGGIGVHNPGRYATQSGFGWTNAVFVRLINEFK